MRRYWLVLLAAGVLSLAGGGLLAGETTEEARGQTLSLWDNIKAGGITEALILLLSVVAMALAIQNAVELRRDRQVPPHVLQELEGLVGEQNYDEAIDLCEREDNFLCNVMANALAKIGNGYERMVEAAGEGVEENASILNNRLMYLSLIASVAPMLGLLGTVVGMIQAFNVIAALRGVANPADLAEGISKALITTATGLYVAIPTLIIYMAFRNRVIRITQEVTVIAGELLDNFRSQ